MAFPTSEELEQRYRALFENETVREVVHARTPSDAAVPVEEEAILDLVQSSDAAHAAYLKSVFHLLDDGG